MSSGELFTLNSDGVYENGETPLFICSPLEVVAKTRSADSDNWGMVVHFRDSDGIAHTEKIPMEWFSGDGSAWRCLLLNRGLRINPARKVHEKLASYLLGARPKKHIRCVAQPGWCGEVFVLPDGCFGPTASEEVVLQLNGEARHRMAVSGTIEDWQRQVGSLCVGNSRLVLAVASAFAGPLLFPLSEEGGGIHIRGPSSTGKTTALYVAGSVWGGGGTRGYIGTWRSTDNGLEGEASQHNDSFLVLDELAQVDPSKAGEIAYMLGNGSGKGRANKSGFVRNRSEWRLLFLSTGEIGLADHMRSVGKLVKAGQEVRLVDIPAEAGSGLGLFENLHGSESAQIFADKLKQHSLKVYGSPIRAFLERFIPARASSIQEIRKCREFFLADYLGNNSSGEVGRVASRLGLIAAAGELAVSLGVLPWRAGEAYEGVGKCFKSWVENRGGNGAADVTRALEQIRQFLFENTPNRFPTLNQDGNVCDILGGKRAGFKRDSGGVTEWLIFPETFRQEVCKGFDLKQVESELIRRGHLRTDSSGGPTRPERIRDINKRIRVYVVSASILSDGVPDVPSVPGADILNNLATSPGLEVEHTELFEAFHDVPIKVL